MVLETEKMGSVLMARSARNVYDELESRANEIADPQEGQLLISPLHVMKSAAGWYLGHACIERMGSDWFLQPYSRESEYYNKLETAQMVLDLNETEEFES